MADGCRTTDALIVLSQVFEFAVVEVRLKTARKLSRDKVRVLNHFEKSLCEEVNDDLRKFLFVECTLKHQKRILKMKTGLYGHLEDLLQASSSYKKMSSQARNGLSSRQRISSPENYETQLVLFNNHDA